MTSEQTLGGLTYEKHSPDHGNAATSVVFLLHGLGSNAQDLMGLVPHWKDAMPNTEFVSPDAPYPCDMAPMGRQWFSLQDRAHGKMLDGCLADKDMAIVGFSQGTMMSLFTMPRREKACAAVLGYSGALFDDGTMENNPETLKKMPILLVHGTDDDVVNFSAFQDSGTILNSVGFNVEGLACKGLGHSIDENGLNQGGQFLAKHLNKNK